MKILINDANILIDLVQLELLHEFADLAFELYTTDFILDEIDVEQQKEIYQIIEEEKFTVITTTEVEDLQNIADLLNSSNGLSFEDCSAWYYSEKMNGTLITGDRKLKREAEKSNVEVRGIIYILDEILKQGLISFDKSIEKIKLLYEINNRLPQEELKKRIKLWGKGEYG